MNSMFTKGISSFCVVSCFAIVGACGNNSSTDDKKAAAPAPLAPAPLAPAPSTVVVSAPAPAPAAVVDAATSASSTPAAAAALLESDIASFDSNGNVYTTGTTYGSEIDSLAVGSYETNPQTLFNIKNHSSIKNTGVYCGKKISKKFKLINNINKYKNGNYQGQYNNQGQYQDQGQYNNQGQYQDQGQYNSQGQYNTQGQFFNEKTLPILAKLPLIGKYQGQFDNYGNQQQFPGQYNDQNMQNQGGFGCKNGMINGQFDKYCRPHTDKYTNNSNMFNNHKISYQYKCKSLKNAPAYIKYGDSNQQLVAQQDNKMQQLEFKTAYSENYDFNFDFDTDEYNSLNSNCGVQIFNWQTEQSY